jgi:hypothetical protein
MLHLVSVTQVIISFPERFPTDVASRNGSQTWVFKDWTLVIAMKSWWIRLQRYLV